MLGEIESPVQIMISEKTPSTNVSTEEAAELAFLRAEVQRLRVEAHDLQIALQNANEHGDALQEYMYGLSRSLAAEVYERQNAEGRMQAVLDAAAQEKADLEILVQILIDQGDISAAEGEKARIDGLTQIANRRRFDECLADTWERHKANGEPFALLICDVDHFKRYNDTYGHPAGDECLKFVAAAIRGCLRADDLIARFGGEEFAVLLSRTDREAALKIAQRALASVSGRRGIPKTLGPASRDPEPAADPGALDGNLEGGVTISIGISSTTPGRGGGPSSMDGLIAEADKNLYAAKQRGRNRVVSEWAGRDAAAGGREF